MRLAPGALGLLALAAGCVHARFIEGDGAIPDDAGPPPPRPDLPAEPIAPTQPPMMTGGGGWLPSLDPTAIAMADPRPPGARIPDPPRFDGCSPWGGGTTTPCEPWPGGHATCGSDSEHFAGA